MRKNIGSAELEPKKVQKVRLPTPKVVSAQSWYKIGRAKLRGRPYTNKKQVMALIKSFGKCAEQQLPSLAEEYGYKNKQTLKSSVARFKKRFGVQQKVWCDHCSDYHTNGLDCYEEDLFRER